MGGSQSYDVVPTSTWPGATGQSDSWGQLYVPWRDSSGNLWLYGGGIDANGNPGFVGALFKMAPSANYEDISWSLERGSLTINDSACEYGTAGVWGTQGVAAKANMPSGRRGEATWTDSQGNFWLFGGVGCPNGSNGTPAMNDLWKYSPTTGEWTWISGPSTIADGGVGVDDGNPGVYGTRGVAASANIPGGREDATTWTDSSGNLWMFGGYGCDGSGNCGVLLDDLWKFDPATSEWTWVSGSQTSTEANPAVYGTKGVAAATNTPGSRYFAAGWADSSGNLWLYGGAGEENWLDDLWKYDPTTEDWTWMGGHNTQGLFPAVYGTKGTAAATNTPGSRVNFAHCSDSTGNLWLFGGDVVGGQGNDLWKYSPATGEWTWMAGSSTVYTDSQADPGEYGTEGVAAAANTPPARSNSVCWFDSSGNLWLFGGSEANDQTGLSDLWYYQIVQQ